MLILEFSIGVLCSLVFVLVVIVIMLIYFIITDFEWDYFSKITKMIWIGITICIVITFGISTPIIKYYNRLQDIEKINVAYNYNLDNILITANKLNEKVIVKTTNDKLIVDVANLSQSTKTSHVFIEYTNNVMKLNNEIAEYKVKSRPGIMNAIVFGLYPELPKDIKYIKIKM